MRQDRTVQASIFDLFAKHEIGCELKKASAWLDDHPALIGRSQDGALDSWIFSGGNSCVRDVFVAGHHVVQNRRHIREEAILKNFRAAVKRLTA